MVKFGQRLFTNSKLKAFLFAIMFALSLSMMGAGFGITFGINKKSNVKATGEDVVSVNIDGTDTGYSSFDSAITAINGLANDEQNISITLLANVSSTVAFADENCSKEHAIAISGNYTISSLTNYGDGQKNICNIKVAFGKGILHGNAKLTAQK